ncbi:MAG: hypothetical protein CR997_04515 [Acidobacteria bacterium]|nr:MAG: hypothetical protein CR997_04515 [Acidobacteriota bacterium]
MRKQPFVFKACLSTHKIGVIGLGRLGHALVASLEEIQADVLVHDLVRHTHPGYTSTLDELLESASILFLTVQDDNLLQLAKDIQTYLSNMQAAKDGKIVIVCSGGFAIEKLDFLKKYHCEVAKMHPLQTFSDREFKPFPGRTPFAIQASAEVTPLLTELIQRLDGKVLSLSRNQWFQYHLAAVVAANFLPLFIRKGMELMEPITRDAELSAEWLRPLINQTVKQALNAENDLPYSGPASRGDREVIQAHTEWLKDRNREFSTIYEVCSREILKNVLNS